MKINHFLLLLVLMMFSCNKDEVKPNTEESILTENLPNQKGSFTYVYKDNSSLTINSRDTQYMKYGIVDNGDNLVFECRFVADDSPQIADDEYSETVFFEINPLLNEFAYSGAELSTIDLVLTKYCFCYFPLNETNNVPPTGSISGKKLSDNSWKIKMDVTFYGDVKRSFERVYVLE